MAQNGTKKPPKFTWTSQRTKAAHLVAADVHTDQEIAAKLGIGRRTLWNWKARAEFAAKVQQIVKTLAARALRFDIARLDYRVGLLDGQVKRLLKVRDARAKDRKHRQHPGGDTGLLVRTEKVIGSGDSAEKVVEVAVAVNEMKELRENLKQAAQELGQWEEKNKLNVDVFKPVEYIVIGSAEDDDDDEADPNQEDAREVVVELPPGTAFRSAMIQEQEDSEDEPDRQ